VCVLFPRLRLPTPFPHSPSSSFAVSGHPSPADPSNAFNKACRTKEQVILFFLFPLPPAVSFDFEGSVFHCDAGCAPFPDFCQRLLQATAWILTNSCTTLLFLFTPPPHFFLLMGFPSLRVLVRGEYLLPQEPSFFSS